MTLEEESKTEKSPKKLEEEDFEKNYPECNTQLVYKNEVIKIESHDIIGEYYSRDFIKKKLLSRQKVKDVIDESFRLLVDDHCCVKALNKVQTELKKVLGIEFPMKVKGKIINEGTWKNEN